jgi:CheY-like chemotaxis protein
MSQTILVIDDFASVRLYHMSFLTRKGYQCIGATDGADALAKLAGHQVDLILLDMVMPGMSGEAFVAELAKIPARAALPVLAITSEESRAKTTLAGNSRPVSVLSKPVMPDVLLTAVQQLLSQATLQPVRATGA